MLISPTFLGIVAAIAGATWLMKFLQKKNDEANTEEKTNERIAADRGSQSSKLAARTILINKDLKSLLADDRTDQDVSDYTRGEIKTKDELAKAISSAEKSGKQAIEIQGSRVAAEARQNLNPPASYNPAKDSQAASAAADLAATPNESAAETQRLMSKKPVQVSSAPSRAPSAAQTNGVELLNRAMDKEGITDPIVRDRVSQLAMVESSMNPAAKGPVIPSGMHKGDQAQGLLQIMPKTAEGLGFSREQISDPETAAIAGVRYFKMNLKRFNDNLDAATVAHHSGPGGAKRWLESGSAGTKDLATGLSTDNYLTKVAGSPTLAPSMATLAATAPMATLAAATPTRPSSIISDSTVALSRVKEESSSAPIVVNAPQTVNNMQQGGQTVAQYTAPSIVDSEFMRMLVSRAV
jgi:soluble lytic murein transglycosylase-like protein